jgi:hypothetical protein
MGNFIDLTNKRFGRSSVMRRAENSKDGKPMWKCNCECGNTVIVRGAALSSGHTVSCGCYSRDIHTTHGGEGTRLYHVWRGMKVRCNNPSHSTYVDYGGRGIGICDEWIKFEKFSYSPHKRG